MSQGKVIVQAMPKQVAKILYCGASTSIPFLCAVTHRTHRVSFGRLQPEGRVAVLANALAEVGLTIRKLHTELQKHDSPWMVGDCMIVVNYSGASICPTT